MSIIQDIREKYAKVTVAVIALALLGFVLTDYFSGKARSGAGMGPSTIGRVNGQKISTEDFAKRFQMVQSNLGGANTPPEQVFGQALQQTWDFEVERILLDEQFGKLGIEVGKKELNDLLFGANPSAAVKQMLGGPNGQYDPNQALQTITSIRKGKDQALKNQLNEALNYLVQERQKEKFIALVSNSVNTPRWQVEKENADNSLLANAAFVAEYYTTVADSLAKVSDKEIADYISNHKKMFKQQESRTISYVTFSASPSAADSLAVRNNLLQLKPEFDTTANLEQFLAGQGISYDNRFQPADAFSLGAKDSVFRIPVGDVYGPFLDGSNYVLARLEGVKQVPDSVKVRHILVATTERDPQTGQSRAIRDTTTAYNLADSIRKEIAKGVPFDSLVVKFSEDPGSKNNGGVYDNVPYGQMVPTFNDFIFLNPPGSKDIVKTDYGYHYIEVLSHEGAQPVYKVAVLPMEILPSEETDKGAHNDAIQFAADSPDQKAFDENYEKTLKAKGVQKQVVDNILPTGSDIRGLGSSRQFVRNIYDAERGEVLKPEKIGNNYVVAAVTEVKEEGTMDVAAGRPLAEPILRNRKKAEILKKKLGSISTLEAAATAWGGKQIETADSLRISPYQNQKLAGENRVIGAIFNPANKGKVIPEALEGLNGVYVVRVDYVGSTPFTGGTVAEQRQSRYTQKKSSVTMQYSPGHPMNILRQAATIKDNRAKIY